MQLLGANEISTGQPPTNVVELIEPRSSAGSDYRLRCVTE